MPTQRRCAIKTLLISVPLAEWIYGSLLPISMDRIKSSPPLGVYWLAGMLRENGYEADVLDLIAHGQIDAELIWERAGRADVVGISCNSLNWPAARMVTELVRSRYREMPIVLGGIHPTGYPEHVLNVCSADYIIQGEGEIPLLKFLDAMHGKCSFLDVPGLGYRDQDRVVVQPNHGLVAVDELENLPDPAYDLLPEGEYETLSIESARGCKFKCTFCSTKFLGSWRGVSAESFVDRMQRLQPYLGRTRYGVFSIIDDLFTLDIERVTEIKDLLAERGMKIQATLDARATDVIRGEVADSLAPITNHMLIGAECGYDEGLRKIAKGCTTKVLEQAAAMLQEVGISNRVVFSFVIGFPFENRKDCERTIHFATKLLMKYNVRIYLQWYNTIPGSKLWGGLRDQGKVDIWMYDDFGFFSNKYLFKAGVPLSNRDIEELSDTIRSINTMLLFSKQADDIIQFARPDWLLHSDTLDFPSHGVLQDGARPENPPAPIPAAARRSDVAGLVGLRGGH